MRKKRKFAEEIIKSSTEKVEEILATLREARIREAEERALRLETETILEEESGTFDYNSLKPKVKPAVKLIFIIALLVCIGASLFFSYYSVSLDAYEYEEIDGKLTMTGFRNTGSITELTLDKAFSEVKSGDWQQNDENVIRVKQYAICCDETLEYIRIGKDVVEIEYQAFYYCTKLKAIFVDEENPNYCSEDGILFNKDKTELILFPINYFEYEGCKLEKTGEGDAAYMTYRIPETVERIAELCFTEVRRLGEVIFPSGLKSIGTLAFFKCEGLNRVTFPDKLEKIGSDAFSYCDKLTYIFIPSSVIEIGHHAFFDCDGLKELCAERDEEDFKTNVKTGEEWLPKHFATGAKLLKKDAKVLYGQRRIV